MSSMSITTASHVYTDNRPAAEQDDAKVSIIPENTEVKCSGKYFLSKKTPFDYADDDLLFQDGTGVDFFNGEDWMRFLNKETFSFTPKNILDIGDELEYGTDYYIYLCFSGIKPELCISKNATYPTGFSSLTSRKIGFFHYGTVRKVSDDGRWIPIDSNGNKFGTQGTTWQQNVTKGVLPNSIGDLKNRPRVYIPGMARIGNSWVCIYEMSIKEQVTFMDGVKGLPVTNGTLKSAYGAIPATGTEGLNQYNFNELARMQGLRLTHYAEWLSAAFGSPQGLDNSDNYGWTKTGNTARTFTGCSIDISNGQYSINGTKSYAVSAYNICDCAGNVWEWQDDYCIRQDSTSWGWYNVLGANQGQAYLPNSLGLTAFICGGYWGGGLHCGPRCVHLSNYPWYVHASIGARFACDAA
ncbi:MAG: SUMF1/EgtB/PvdO family nonheme iron enzyme [Treponema sp.]|nr:SUMF1/EgtB/PvdO family nonheme iron enzyme [Treponema sp.]